MPHDRQQVQDEVRSAVIYGELLAALFSSPMDRAQLDTWVREHDAALELAEAVWRGSVRLTAKGGAALNGRRHRDAVSAMLHDLLTP
ncbi:hypothetical protein [Cellulomonas sp. RIT-PI-Y]|uniref:hypothetical protein n=1 Tax=Cellulomonas sp. RIT-PI-Y TaxID=3035297 RepID=UPI0021DB4CD1|nr:hypothetical protein [Cellulomonas sp. RIT-PI-Y]